MKFIWSNLRSRLRPEMANVLLAMYTDRVKSKSVARREPLTAEHARKLLNVTYIDDYDAICVGSTEIRVPQSEFEMLDAVNKESAALREEVFNDDVVSPTSAATATLSDDEFSDPDEDAEDDYVSDVDDVVA